MGIISGSDSHCQIKLESTWGTSVTPDEELPFTGESLRYVPNYTTEDALVGKKTANRMDIQGTKVEGGVDFIVTADRIGTLLTAALGAESAQSQVGSTSAYSHIFSPIAGGSGKSLPHLTIGIDRKVDYHKYVSCKINTLTLEADVNDYVRGSIDIIGYDEETGTVQSLTSSSLKALKFADGTVEVDDTSYDLVTSFSFNYSNNLEDDLFTISSTKMQEIEPQQREITAELEVLYNSTSNTTRTNKFAAGSTAKIELDFEGDDIAGGQGADEHPYRLKLTMPLCYINEADPQVSGPERIRMTLNVTATEDNSNEALTVLLIDKQGSKYNA